MGHSSAGWWSDKNVDKDLQFMPDTLPTHADAGKPARKAVQLKRALCLAVALMLLTGLMFAVWWVRGQDGYFAGFDRQQCLVLVLSVLLSAIVGWSFHAVVSGSARLQAPQATGASDEVRDRLFRLFADIVGIYDLAENRFVQINEGWTRVSGYSIEETLRMSPSDWSDPGEAERISRDMAHVLNDKTGFAAYVAHIRCQDGSYRTVEWQVGPPEPGSTLCYVVGRDITEDETQLLTHLGGVIPAYFYVYDLTSQRTKYHNDKIRALLGYGTGQMSALDAEPLELIHPDDEPKLQALFAQIARSANETVVSGEYRLRAADGSYCLFVGRHSVFRRDADGQVCEIAGTVTPLNELEVLKKYNVDLEKSNSDLEEYAYVASHDLRQPLRGISHLVNWVYKDAYDVLPPESRQHLLKINDRVKRLEHLLNDLLGYSRAGRGSASARGSRCGDVDPEHREDARCGR